MNYGFIGLGNMAGAIIRGMHRSGLFAENTVYGYDSFEEKAQAIAAETGLVPCRDNCEVVANADVVVFAVKPQMMEGMLAAIPAEQFAGKLVISIAAGVTLAWYESRLPGVAVIRTMPNINAIVGCASTALCKGTHTTDAHMEIAKTLFSAVGSVYPMEERLVSGFSAICGASDAFTFLYVEALASAGVKQGFPKPMALQMAKEVVLGAAKLLESGAGNPMELADMVCSPGGTTIEGVHKLREHGFEYAVYEAVGAVADKDRLLGKK